MGGPVGMGSALLLSPGASDSLRLDESLTMLSLLVNVVVEGLPAKELDCASGDSSLAADVLVAAAAAVLRRSATIQPLQALVVPLAGDEAPGASSMPSKCITQSPQKTRPQQRQ